MNTNRFGRVVVKQPPTIDETEYRAELALITVLIMYFSKTTIYELNIYGQRHMTQKEILQILFKKKKKIVERHDELIAKRDNDTRTRWTQ